MRPLQSSRKVIDGTELKQQCWEWGRLQKGNEIRNLTGYETRERERNQRPGTGLSTEERGRECVPFETCRVYVALEMFRNK